MFEIFPRLVVTNIFVAVSLFQPSARALENKIRFDASGKPVAGTYDEKQELKYKSAPGLSQEDALFQTCDPKLLDSFYRNLYSLACQRSDLSFCPYKWNPKDWTMNDFKSLGSSALYWSLMMGSAVDLGRAARRGSSPLRSRMGQVISRSRGPIVRTVLLLAFWEWMDRSQTKEREDCRNKMPYMEYNDQCRPTIEEDGEFKVGDAIRGFLELSPSRQESLLKNNPPLCEYYAKFNKALADKVELHGEIRDVRCDVGHGAHQFKVVNSSGTRDEDSKLFQLMVAGDGSASKLVVQRPQVEQVTGHRVDHLDRYDISFSDVGGKNVVLKAEYRNDLGVPVTLSYAEISTLAADYRRLFPAVFEPRVSRAADIFAGLREHKYYSNMVNACCSIADDQARARCVGELEGHKGIALVDARQLVDSISNPSGSGSVLTSEGGEVVNE